MSKILIIILAVSVLSGGLFSQGILEPHAYMPEGIVKHNGGTATVRSDHARPLERAITAVSEEYGWDVHYEDPPYGGKYDLIDLTNPNYRAAHPDAMILPGPAGGPFESTYSEGPNTLQSRDQEELVLRKIVSDYNLSRNPGHFVVRLLSDGSFDVVGDGTHDDNGVEVPVSPILDTPISIPSATRGFGETINAIMNALSVKTGVHTGGVAFGPSNLVAGGHITMGGPGVAPAREFFLQLFSQISSKWKLVLIYEPPPRPAQYVIGLRMLTRAEYDLFGHKRLIPVGQLPSRNR